MKTKATTLALLLMFMGLTALPALAQPDRNGVDVIWARDVAGATITMDGILNEPAWDAAESITLQWGSPLAPPGSGQRIEGQPTLAEPSDGNNGELKVLRNGNEIWFGVTVQDKSIGGARNLWGFDGFIMSIIDRTARDRINYEDANNFIRPQEFIFGFWNPSDTTDATSTYADGTTVASSGLPRPGLDTLSFFGDYGVNFFSGDPRTADDVAVWDAVTTIDGIANDDTHGEDVGYTVEMRFDFGALGYDFSQSGTNMVPMNFALQDSDFNWPNDPNLSFLSRVWWQNQWANNFVEGAGYIAGSPDITITSGALPAFTEPEFTIPSGDLFDAPTVDGSLDDPIWDRVDDQFFLKYGASAEEMDLNAGSIAPHYMRWFRPDINGDGRAAVVVDPSSARFKMFFKDTKLYVGVNVDDQAISGIASENGRDGVRVLLRAVDSLTTSGTYATYGFDFAIDSTGAVQYARDAARLIEEKPGSVMAGVHLNGAGTAADPTDVDEGYQLEIEIDLVEALGYPANLGDGRLFLALNFFDGDFLETAEASYAMRTWISGERTNGAAIYGYLDSDTVAGVANEDEATLPTQIRLLGNYPNPFNPSTTLRYALPQAGDVTVQVFDVLGRQVAELNPGLQGAGTHALTFDASSMASGMYLYRLQVRNQATGEVRLSGASRMVLLK